MTDRDLARMLSKPVNRRSALAAMGLAGGAAALAACTGGTGATTAPSASAAPSAAPSASAAGSPSAAPSVSAAPAANVENELLMYNWAQYVSPDNMKLFQEQFKVDTFTYDVYDNNEALLAKLQAGGGGYDIAAPTAEYVPGMVEEGYLTKLDKSRLPNTKYINAAFKGIWWDPTDEYQVPKDYGTTGILYMKSKLSKPPASW